MRNLINRYGPATLRIASGTAVVGLFALGMTETPDGHFKVSHLWPGKLSQAGRVNYA